MARACCRDRKQSTNDNNSVHEATPLAVISLAVMSVSRRFIHKIGSHPAWCSGVTQVDVRNVIVMQPSDGCPTCINYCSTVFSMFTFTFCQTLQLSVMIYCWCVFLYEKKTALFREMMSFSHNSLGLGFFFFVCFFLCFFCFVVFLGGGLGVFCLFCFVLFVCWLFFCCCCCCWLLNVPATC